ncbi:hypothetical protein CORT_0B07710 [Candida orthopsilosis Co 90-125]|uniref:Uncharacterized protein n=1 Tax=Candida orthopsilosis (strain 90-125) TaxID=1136231 RepID=H8X1S2_CANO9|nr:hypothetical protein CORT_0B07710 [Candida orthopsilosis Co 90-125]CCG22477.1 hypothetical protein CORT_0B07710 [Candida orthopsilosis Co 90-125]
MMLQKPKIHQLRLLRLRTNQPIIKRFNSNKNKFSSIEEFNRNKTKYSYGYNFESLKELDDKTQPPEHSKRSASEDTIDINEVIENDPRLTKLKPGSHEYRETLHQLHQEFISKQKNSQKRHEFNERMRGVFYGVAALVGVVSVHQIFMNYESIKNRLLMNYTYKDFKDEVVDVTKKNVKSSKHLMEKLEKELSDENIAQLKHSKETPGVYSFGDNTKIPIRIPAFDGIYLKDAFIESGHIIAITDKGKVVEWEKGQQKLKEIKLPFVVNKITASADFFYYLTSQGEIVYTPRKPAAGFFPMLKRNWLGLLKSQTFNKIEAQNVVQFSSGLDHLLFLTSQGQIFVVNTSKTPKNLGQFGPQYSPFDKKKIPINKPIEMTLLNNEMVKDGNQKLIVSRKFIGIASGNYFNIVSDANDSVWTWGDNSYGQCGNSNTTKLEPIPQKVFDKNDYKRICRNVFGKTAKEADFEVSKVLASKETSYIILRYMDQNAILSMGNGLNGQLGGGKYLHVCSYPEIVKSLIGLKEYDEESNSVKNIDIKDATVGNDHIFIVLNNGGPKDVFALGSNQLGQFGNGKKIKACKPTRLPRLLEPQDGNDKLTLAKSINDMNTQRLQLLDDHRIGKHNVEQVIVAGEDCSMIYYKIK